MNLFLTVVVVLGLGAAAFAAPDSVKQVSLEDAKKFAVHHNYEVLALKQALEEARAGEGRARAPFFPTLGVAGGGDTQISTGMSEPGVIGYVYGTYNVFNGFEDFYEARVASLEAEKAEVKLQRVQFRVGLDVEEAFHLYIFKKRSIDLKKDAVATNEKHRKMAAQKRNAGMAADSDIMEFDLMDALLQSDLLLLNQELEEARTGLRKLLGEEVGSKIEPVGELQHQHLNGTLMDHVGRIKSDSESVLLTTRDLAIANAESKRSTSKWLPKVDIEVNAGYLPWDLRTVPTGQSMIGGKIVARFDIFSGFDTMYERRQNEAKRLRLENELKNTILTAISDTENAYRRIATIQARVDLEEKNEDRSRKYYNSVLSEYRRGVKNSGDLRNAAQSVYETALKREGFKHDFLEQRIQLERALGAPVSTELIIEKPGKTSALPLERNKRRL